MIDNKERFKEEIEGFAEAFKEYKDKKIVLYGTGRYASLVLNGIEDMNFIGLSDKDEELIGKTKYNYPVIGKEEAEKKADMLIICTSRGYWNTIYNRIKDWDLPIFFFDGTRPTDEERVNESDEYWNIDKEYIIKEIQKYDVVTFDIFDTLIGRNLCVPNDIFDLLEQRSEIKGFADIRRNVAPEVLEKTIDDIYEYISYVHGWDYDKCLELKEMEIELDTFLMKPRKEMVHICNEAMKTHKVYFVTDMYYTKSILIDVLKKAGIYAKSEQILISGELEKTKKTGELWKYFREQYVANDKIVHIGDNLISDCKRPGEYGIDSILIRSSQELCENSSLQLGKVDNSTSDTSVALGMIVNKMFNNPFCLSYSKGYMYYENAKDMGYCLLGGAVYTFSKWLYESAIENRVKNLVFLGRDGYLMKPQFDKYLELINKEDDINTYYLETSRLMVLRAMIESEQDIKEALEAYQYNGTYGNLFRKRFGVEIREYEDKEYIAGSKESDELLGLYKDEILNVAKEQRKRYTEYIVQTVGKEDFAVVDLYYTGTIQYYLSRILKRGIDGYYMTAQLNNSNPYLKVNNMYGCYGNWNNRYESRIFKWSIFMDAFYTAPNGMVEAFDRDNRPIYEENKLNQKNYEVRNEMQKGIFEFMKEAREIERKLNINIAKKDLWNEVFDIQMESKFVPLREVKEGFYRDDSLAGSEECRIWA